MTQKEKAYDEALALMQDCIPDKDGYVHVRPCDIFSELKENEDEEIRQAMINFFKSERIKDGIAVFHFGVNIEKMIAWLEKQGQSFPILSNSSKVGKNETKWSEEEEHHWMMCLECVEECATQEREDFSKTISWLKQLKQRLEQ